MLVFIVPLKSRTVSNSWARVSELLERTLRSICAQTSDEFRVIVVCNELPDFQYRHAHLEFLMVDIYPTESSAKWINRGREDDKARRILAGNDEARKYDPSYVMVVDADDCIRNDLVEYVSSAAPGRGWYLPSGYVYVQGRRWIYKKRSEFQKLCGSSLILKPDDMEKVVIEDDLGLFYWHFRLPSDSVPLDPLPFAGAVYTVRNNENHHMTSARESSLKSGQPGVRIKTFLRRVSNYRLTLLTSRVRQKFGLYAL